MKKFLLVAYIFFCTCGTYAQDLQNVVVAEIDFNKQPAWVQFKSDTVRATLLITTCKNKCIPFTYEGYVVFRDKDTIYLDDRRISIKPPVTVWNFKTHK